MTECSVCGEEADERVGGYGGLKRSFEAGRVCVNAGGRAAHVYLHDPE